MRGFCCESLIVQKSWSRRRSYLQDGVGVPVFVAPDLAREFGRAVDLVHDDTVEAVEHGLEVGVKPAVD